MTDPLRFAAPLSPGGRMCLLCGSVTVGAVFPPGRGGWRWSCWVTLDGHFCEGVAKTEDDAKTAVLAEFNRFLREARLVADPQSLEVTHG